MELQTVTPEQSPTRAPFLPELLLWLIPAWLAVFSILIIHYELSVNAQEHLTLTNEEVIVDLSHQMIGDSLNQMTADVKMLSFVVQQNDEQPQNQRIQNITRYFSELSISNGNYSQVRFINVAGQEIIRVNNKNNQLTVVPQQQLQNKAQRYYFQKSMKLTLEQIYISPLDLNVEGGKIETPFSPTIRVGSAVFDSAGNRLGVVILNYEGNKLIEKLLAISPNFINHLFILNPEGTAVIKPTGKDAQYNFRTENDFDNRVWDEIKNAESGQFFYNTDYFTFTHVSSPSDQHWTIISVLPKDRMHLVRYAFTDRYLLPYSILIGLLTLVAIAFTRYRIQARLLKQQRRYEKQFRHTLENLQLAAVTVSASGRVVFCNDFFLNMVGCTKQQVIGQDWITTFTPKKLQQQAAQALKQALHYGLDQPLSESVVLAKSGEIRLVSWASTFSKHKESIVSAVTFIGEDVTEKQTDKEQLRRFSHVIENSENSVMITDLSGCIIYINAFFLEQTGYNRDEVIGRSPKFLQSGELQPESYQTLWQTISEGNEWHGEFHNKKKNGELYWERVRISPVKDVEGNKLYYIAVKQDITEEKRLIDEVERQTREKIKHEKLAAVGKVVNMIAHDLRNPLSSIKMAMQIFSRKTNDELCDISLEQIRYMEAILEDLLSYSRPDQFKPEWIDLNRLVELVMLSQQKYAKEQCVLLTSQCQPNLPTIYADTTKLRQALQNLIINAIQAASAEHKNQPEVKLSTNLMMLSGDTRLLIEIRNNGKTIAPCLTEKVFEPFFTTKAKGTGLGLAIVKRIIDNHKGKINLNLQEPNGTVAKIQLPASPVSNEEIKAVHYE